MKKKEKKKEMSSAPRMPFEMSDESEQRQRLHSNTVSVLKCIASFRFVLLELRTVIVVIMVNR